MIVFSPEQDQYLQLSMSRAYYQGRREGVSLYAHWKDGVQYVGTTGRTLKQALADIDQQETDTLIKYTGLKQI